MALDSERPVLATGNLRAVSQAWRVTPLIYMRSARPRLPAGGGRVSWCTPQSGRRPVMGALGGIPRAGVLR
jgi:hypothetical protein